jgi:LPS-assembly protein
MQSKSAITLSCIAAALAFSTAAAGSPADDEQWQCDGAAGGGWKCSVIGKPAGPYTQPARPLSWPLKRRERSDAEIAEADELAETMDWVPRARLDEAQRLALETQCQGAYVEPPMEASAEATTQFGTILASATESELRQNPEVATFSGNVTVRQDERRLRADKATYYREEERVDIEGDVQYREPGLLVRGESAAIATTENSGTLRKARFVMHGEHTNGEADVVTRNTDGSISLEDAVYTQCEPGQDDWQLAAESIHLDRETGQGRARHARLEVKGVPVLYTPYLRFPIDDRRMSGLLWPTFTNSSQNGLDVTVPYYFNLAPNYDATFLPRYTNERGTMAGGEFRYLNRWSYWAASGSLLPDDDIAGEDRWLTSLQHQGNPLAHTRTAISYTEVSDEDYLRHLSPTGLEVKRSTHLPQLGQVEHRVGNNWLLRAKAQQYQLLDDELTEPYKMLPRIEANRNFNRIPFQLDYALASEVTVFEHKDSTRITGQRVYIEPQLAYPMEWAAAFVRPAVSYQSISYNLDEGLASGSDDSPSVGAAQFSLDAGYFLERDNNWFGGNFLQTLEPRAFYLWVDHDDHGDIPNFDSSDLTFSFSQLFRTTRFSGRDRIADANQASLSVTSRLITDDTGLEMLTASIGQIVYFEDRRVSVCDGLPSTDSLSPCRSNTAQQPAAGNLAQPQPSQTVSSSEIAAELQLQPVKALRVSGTTLWDPHEDRLNEGGVLMHWSPVADTIVNLGYRYRREPASFDELGRQVDEDIDQADFSAALPINDRWKVFVRYQYDLNNDYSLEELAGLEYSSCCWALRMVYQEGLDWDKGRDHGFYLQFVLRGLGGLGKNIDQLLQDSIFGFGRPEDNSLAY